jgi:hypothetical protein
MTPMHPIKQAQPSTKSSFWIIAIFSLLFGLWTNAATAQTQVRATVDRNQLSLDETLTLSLTADSISFSADPEVQALEQDFRILNQQESSRSSFINGKVSSLRQWDYTLSPKRKGNLSIPSIQMGKYRTRPITVTVSDAPQRQNTGSEQVYLESDVTPRSAYVQSELAYTVKIFTSVNFLEASLEPLEVSGATVEAAGEERYQTTINGRYYQVIERRYRLYPQHSGELEIPALTLQARVESYRQSMLDPGRLVVKRSSAHRVRVMPPASDFDGAVWLPAKALSISDSWSQSLDSIEVGDSVTRSIKIEADGLLGSQLPALPSSELANAKLYPDQASISNPEEGDWTGQRTESVAIIPTKPGSYELPEIRIAWWNTESNQQEYAVLPPRKFTVTAPVSQQPANPPPSSQGADTKTDAETIASTLLPNWQWAIIAVLALGNLLFASLWLRAARSTPAAETAAVNGTANLDEKATFKALRQACKRDGNTNELRQKLLDWGSAALEENVSLTGLAGAFPNLDTYCRALDASLYSQDEMDLDRNALLHEVSKCRKTLPKTATKKVDSGLRPLYPND